MGCRGRIHTWGLLAQLAPQVACSWASPRERGAGERVSGEAERGQFASPALLRRCSFHTCRLPSTGGMGVSQLGSGLLRKKEHVAASERVPGSAGALVTPDASPCALLHLFVPPWALVKAEPTCSDWK